MRFARVGAWGLALAAASCGESRGTLVTTTDGAIPGVWRPVPASTWQVQLSGALDTSFDVAIYDVDLDQSAATLASLRAAGRRVICYGSVGTYEPWRDDAGDIPTAARGQPLANYPDERWLDPRDAAVRAVMVARLDVARQKGC